MNPHQLARMFPNASKSVLEANACDYGANEPDFQPLIHRDSIPHPESTRQTAKSECAPVHAALGQAQAQGGDRPGFLVVLTSVRKRLLDEDNLVGKFHTDLLRYSGVIPSDAPGQTSIQTKQRKAAKGEEEHTVIEVFRTA
jgi:hypothetical protein